MKKSQIVGWIISIVLVGLLAVGSAGSKLTEWDGKAEMFGKLGFALETMRAIGFVEIAIAVVFLIPRTGFLAAILLTAYLGGATAAHVRVGDAFVVPIIIGVVAWVALGLRQPQIFRLALGEASGAKGSSEGDS